MTFAELLLPIVLIAFAAWCVVDTMYKWQLLSRMMRPKWTPPANDD